VVVAPLPVAEVTSLQHLPFQLFILALLRAQLRLGVIMSTADEEERASVLEPDAGADPG
jgi:hypothetical protein